MDEVTVSIVDAIATVTLDRPEKRNRLSKRLLESIVDACASLSERADLRVVVVQASGSDFSLGADLTDPGMRAVVTAPLGERRLQLRLGPRVARALQELPQITIAAIQGYCLGGGAVVALACDLRVVAADLKFGAPEAQRGMNMSWHSVPLLVAHFGPARTKELLVSGRLLDADTALAWGFANRTSGPGPDAVQHEAQAWAAHLVETTPPIQASMIKETVNAIANAHVAAVHMDRDQYILAQTSEDFGEAVQAFLEKRPPHFRGR